MSRSVLGRGWTPPAISDRQKAGIAVLLGLALVTAPFWVGPVTEGLAPDDTYRYEAVPVEPANGSLAFEERPRRGLHHHGIWGIDCYPDDANRRCNYAWALRDRAVTVPNAWFDAGHDFVHLDRFYEPKATATDGGTRLRLDPVTSGHVLDAIAEDSARMSADVQRVLERGEYTTTTELAGDGTVVDTEDGYRLVALTEYRSGHGAIPLPDQFVLEFFGVMAGLVLFRVAQRHADRAAADNSQAGA